MPPAAASSERTRSARHPLPAGRAAPLHRVGLPSRAHASAALRVAGLSAQHREDQHSPRAVSAARYPAGGVPMTDRQEEQSALYTLRVLDGHETQIFSHGNAHGSPVARSRRGVGGCRGADRTGDAGGNAPGGGADPCSQVGPTAPTRRRESVIAPLRLLRQRGLRGPWPRPWRSWRFAGVIRARAHRKRSCNWRRANPAPAANPSRRRSLWRNSAGSWTLPIRSRPSWRGAGAPETGESAGAHADGGHAPGHAPVR